MRTALYIRVSSRDQVQRGISIPDQLARLRAEAKSAGEVIVAEFIDQARSGASAAKREEFQKLLAAARRRGFDRLRVESVDRGHRNDMERRQFEADMTILEIEVVYSGEPEKQAPQYRKLQRGIKGVLAEWESDETSQRTYKRHRYRAQQGKWRGGTPPYGTRPDGQGWLEPDPLSYPYLLWILERRALGLGHHTIANQLNTGIQIGDAPAMVPPTPGLLIYQRRPYIEQQDPETGDVLHLPRDVPSGAWTVWRVQKICAQVVDGVYAGLLIWGRTHNRFEEDAEGRPKRSVTVDTGKPLVPVDLLRRVQAVELAARQENPTAMPSHAKYLLSLGCGLCGEAMHGYTSTKYKNDKAYKYRKYRCVGRVNKTGSCSMPIISAEALEEAVFIDACQSRGDSWLAELRQSAAQRRTALEHELSEKEQQLKDAARRRTEALDTLLDRTLSSVLSSAMAVHAEDLVRQCEEIEGEQRRLRTELETLQAQVLMVKLTLNTPLLETERWSAEEAQQALKRALRLLCHKMVLIELERGRHTVEIWLHKAEYLLVRQTLSHESAWESNPPTKLVTSPTGFEDQDSHRATSALGGDCSP